MSPTFKSSRGRLIAIDKKTGKPKAAGSYVHPSAKWGRNKRKSVGPMAAARAQLAKDGAPKK